MQMRSYEVTPALERKVKEGGDCFYYRAVRRLRWRRVHPERSHAHSGFPADRAVSPALSSNPFVLSHDVWDTVALVCVTP
jgi:hypothetical protein